MKIHNPKTGEFVINDYCHGACWCHSMDMIHGADPNHCAECGCPKTLAGFQAFKDRSEQARAANAVDPSAQLSGTPTPRDTKGKSD